MARHAVSLLVLLTLIGGLAGPLVNPQPAAAKPPRRRSGVARSSDADQILRVVRGGNPAHLKWRPAPRPLPATLDGDWERLAKPPKVGLAWYTIRRQGSTAKVSVSALVGDTMHYDWFIVHMARRRGRWVKTRTEEDGP